MIARALKQKIAWSTFVQFAGKIIQIGLGIVAVKITSNALGAEQFGVVGKIVEFTLFFSMAANLGIFGNTVRTLGDHPQDGHRFANAMIVRLITAVIFLASGATYAFIFIDDPIFLSGMLFFMGSLFFDFALSVCTGALQANYKMGRSVFAVIVSRLAELALLLFLVSQNQYSPISYFLPPLLAAFIALALSYLFVRRCLTPDWTLHWPHIKHFLFASIPFGIINILNSLYFRFIPEWFASHLLSDAEFAHLHLANLMAQNAALFSTFLMFSTLPAFKTALTEKHFRRAKELYKKIRLFLVLLAIATILGGIFIGPHLLVLVSGPSFLQASLWYVLPMLFTLASVSYFYDLTLITLFAMKMDRWFLGRECIAFLTAGAFFLASLALKDPHASVMLVLLGAICGESLIVGLSLPKIRSLLGTSSSAQR